MGKKVIMVTTTNKISIHDFPSSNKDIYNLIGCRLFEHVMPNRLYTELGITTTLDAKRPGSHVSMLIDEEGLLKEHPVFNPIGSFLYETDVHGHSIVGNILFVGEVFRGDGIDFCGIDDEVFEDLLKSLTTLCNLAKEAIS